MSEAHRAVSVRGVPAWLIRDYLAEMGASADLASAPQGVDAMDADGWSVSWTSRRVPIAGSATLTLTQHDLVFTGEARAVDEAARLFLAKAQRGGG